MSFNQCFLFLQQLSNDLLGLYLYQDYIEVAVFICIIYKSLIWLKQDHTKQLVVGSYLYFAGLFSTYYFSCSILFSTMLTLTPALIALSIIAHQKQLQKNFMLPSKKFITPKAIPHKNWLNSLIQSCLISSHHQKHITCIVERADHLHTLLDAPFLLHLPIQEDIINLILSSSAINNTSLLWINQSGIMQSINVSWKSFLTEELFISKDSQPSVVNHEAATLMTQKTDALVFEINTSNNNNIIWYQGKCMQNLTVKELLLFLKEVIELSSTTKPFIKRKQNDQANHPS